MKTSFAPAERAAKDDILNDYKSIMSSDYFKTLFNSLPYIVAILNYKRQIIFSNKILLDSLNIHSIEEVLGLRPGEAISCIHSKDEQAGCGTSESCKYCGAVQAILESQRMGIKVSQECRISSTYRGKEVSYDFLVTASPLVWNGGKFTILSLNDISNTKRRVFLERIFFHDVINKIGSLNGFLELIKEVDDPKKIKEFISGAIEVSNDITEDIVAQRELIAAETDQLTVHKMNYLASEIISNAVNQMMHHEVAKDKTIVIDHNSANITINTDYAIIKRVLTNMLKNALEAIKPKQVVTIGCTSQKHAILFWVHNQTFIPREIELQIFQRSFSTKASNRGLGTYSIKMLTEKYLGGKAYFTTDEKEGTKFYIYFPV
jgi:PAS domain-containing protein